MRQGMISIPFQNFSIRGNSLIMTLLRLQCHTQIVTRSNIIRLQFSHPAAAGDDLIHCTELRMDTGHEEPRLGIIRIFPAQLRAQRFGL